MSLVRQTHSNLSLYVNYFTCKFSRLWNNLSQSIRTIKSLPFFARCIDAYCSSGSALNVLAPVPPEEPVHGSDNRPHTSNSTQDHYIHNQPPSIPIIPPTPTFNAKLPLSASPLSVTIANDSSAQNTVPGLPKPRSKLHIGAFNVRTLCQIGQQAPLARTLESRTND
ncbi:unnamed protein product, partial [Schistosoma curassoni]